MTAVDPALLALAGVGLSDLAVPRRGWADRLEDVFSHGLAGFLAEAYHRELVELDEATRARLRTRIQSDAIRAVQLEGELIRLESVFAELDAVLLKGAALAHAAYPHPALRPFTDLDVLVTGAHHEAAVMRLEEHGYQRSRPEPSPGYDSSVGKALTMVHPGGVVIDLHRTLVAGLAGASVKVDEIIEEHVTLSMNRRPVAAPSWEAHLVEVCLHGVVGDGLGRALSLRDIAQVALHPDLDAGRAVELAHRWKVAPIVATGLRTAVECFGVHLPGALSALAEQSSADAPQLSARSRSSRSRLAELHGGGLRRRLTVARSLITPSPDFLRFTYGDHALPGLYLRRWRSLYRRSRDAAQETHASRPPVAPPVTGTVRRLPTVPDGSGLAARARTPARPHREGTIPPVVAAAAGRVPSRRVAGSAGPTTARAVPARAGAAAPAAAPPVATVTLARRVLGLAAVGPVAPVSLSAAALPPPLSRQERWEKARPPRSGAPARRPEGGARALPPPPPLPSATEAAETPDAASGPSRASAPTGESGAPLCVGGVISLLATIGAARLGADWAGIVLVPVAGLLFALAMSRRLERIRVDEAWVGRWLVLAVVAKLGASYFRYLTLVNTYNSNGDASGYDMYGREFAAAWMGHGSAPYLPDLRKTNFLRWFTGVVYYVFGSNMVAGFFVFGLLALIGSYLWYRATAESVPFLDKRIYLALVLFAPSIAFWPSSIGKESLMQLGLGVVALAAAMFLRQRLLLGLLIGLPGGWLLWVVRPHLLAMAVIGAGFAYMIGRVRPKGKDTGAVGTRTIGLIVMAFIMAFSVGQMMQFLGMKDLSLNSIDQTLSEQQARTAEGGSSFDNGGDYLSPANLPRGVVTVLLRPFPWEAGSPLGLLASLESAAVAGMLIVRFSSVRASLSRARRYPFLLYCWVFTFLFAASFSSFANFGLLVRERSLVLPAFFVLLSLRPERDPEEIERAERAGHVPVPAASS